MTYETRMVTDEARRMFFPLLKKVYSVEGARSFPWAFNYWGICRDECRNKKGQNDQ